MRLSIDALLVIDAIDRKGSFAAAAAELHRVPSAVTYTVQKIEQDLGVMVFDRSGHRARLTTAGQFLLAEGRPILNALSTLESRVKTVASGWEPQFRIAISDFIDSNPLIELINDYDRRAGHSQLSLLPMSTNVLWDALHQGDIDLALGLPEQTLSNSGFRIKSLGSVEFIFVAAPKHPLAKNHGLVPMNGIYPFRIVHVSNDFSVNKLKLPFPTAQKTLTVSNQQAKLNALLAGIGVGYISKKLATPFINNGRLVVLQTEDILAPFELSFAWLSKNPGNTLRWFIEHIDNQETKTRLC